MPQAALASGPRVPSQPLGTPDRAVPARYSHFLQMWEFLEDASGLQDRDFIVVQAPGADGRGKSSGDGCEGPGTDQSLSQTQRWRCSSCRMESAVGGRRFLQLGRGLRDALRDLGELQVGALDHVGFAAALRGADHVAVALAVQLVILRPCTPARAAWAPAGRGTGGCACPPLL